MSTAEPKKLHRPFPRLLREYFRRAGWLWIIAPFNLLLMVAISVAQSVIPRVVGKVVDLIRSDPAHFTAHQAAPALGIAAGIAVVFYLMEYTQKVGGAWFAQRIRARFQCDLYRHLLSLSEDFYHRTKAGEISTRLTQDMDRGVEPFYMNLVACVWAIALLISSSVMLFGLHPILCAVYTGMVAVWLTVIGSQWHRLEDWNRQTTDRVAAVSAKLTEEVASQELVRAFAKEEQQAEEMHREMRGALALLLRLARFTTAMHISIITVLQYVIPLTMLFVSVTVLRSHLSVGDVVATYGIWIAAAIGVHSITFSVTGFAQSCASLDRILDFFDEQPLVRDAPNAPALTMRAGEITFEHVSFSYPLRDTETVLHDLDLTIRAKGSTAIVGATGSGKSTVVSLIMRLYDPNAGNVSIDGQDLRSVSQRSVRRQIGLVMQDTILWSGTIRENLRFVKPEATDEEMVAALRHAELWDFVEGTTDKLETVVGERGVRLSGGQKQRMAIARAFLLDPPIVILDEATSSLDSLTERSIQATMRKLFNGRTAVTVAHRLSTILDCEWIVVLDKGEVIGQGVHEDLVKTCAKYRDMCLEQHVMI
jgi:ABC-type multidrug transport system fused ATPase/permease subunit